MTGQMTLDPDVVARARILVVDDHRANVMLLESLLARVGYRHVRATTDPRSVPALCQEFDPDLILLDLHMPDLDGFEVMEQLAGLIPHGAYLPILVLTADIDDDVCRRALAAGAHDFLSKPFDVGEVQLRIANLLRTRFLHMELARHNDVLEERVRERTLPLDAARLEVLRCLSLAAEYRDDNTGEHIRRVGEISAAIPPALDWPVDRIELIGQAAPLHDVGKLGISDVILRKPGKLTPDEFAHIKTHTLIGPQILAGTHIPVLRLATEIARTHHEKRGGTGYPDGRKGIDIAVSGRIVAVADVFDALTHVRPYKSAWPVEMAIDEIIADAATTLTQKSSTPSSARSTSRPWPAMPNMLATVACSFCFTPGATGEILVACQSSSDRGCVREVGFSVGVDQGREDGREVFDDEIFRDVTVGSEITQRSGLVGRFVLVRRHHQDMGLRERGPQGREGFPPREDGRASLPVRIGMPRSSTIRSGWSCVACRMASSLSPAWPTTVIPARRIILTMRALTTASSSTTSACKGRLSSACQSRVTGGRTGLPNR